MSKFKEELFENIESISNDRNKYMSIVFYVLMTFVLCYLSYLLINYVINMLDDVVVNVSGFVSIIQPFIVGTIIAYLLNPIVKYYERLFNQKLKVNNRSIIQISSIVVSILTVVLVLLLFAYSVYLMINGSLKGFTLENFNASVNSYLIQFKSITNDIDLFLSEQGVSQDSINSITKSFNNISSLFSNVFVVTYSSIGSIIKAFINTAIGFMFAIYVLGSKDFIKKLYHNIRLLLPFGYPKNITLLRDVDRIIKSYLKIIMVDLGVMSFITYIFLLFIGFPFAFVLAIFSSYVNIIPYVGAYLGAIPAIFIGAAEKGIGYGIFAYFYIVIVQGLHATFITPKIQGDGIGVHPMFVLIGLTFFGAIFGFVGMLIAVPLTAIVQLFVVRISNFVAKRKGIELVSID